MIAIEVGIVVSSLLFMKRMAEVTDVTGWKYIEEPDVTDGEAEKMLSLSKHIRVFEISGPMFFAAADRLTAIDSKQFTKVVIIRMRSVPAIDASAMHSLHSLADRAERKKIRLVFSHVNEQPLSVMKKDGFFDRIGANNFRSDIIDAIDYAEHCLQS